MKKINLLVLLAGFVVLVACNKVAVVSPSFNVTVANTTVKAKDTVTFNFSGAPNFISFYSGEPGHIYANRIRSVAKQSGVLSQFSFTSNVSSGSVTSAAVVGVIAGATYQANVLAVLISTNFNGIMDSADVRKATWTDISSRAKLGTSTTNVSSGTVDISDFQAMGDSVYIAYRYAASISTTTSIAPVETVGTFLYKNSFPDGTSYAYNTVSTDARYGGFQQVSLLNPALLWSLNTTLVFPIGAIGEKDEDWAISQPFNFYRTTPDVAVAVKYPNVIAPTASYQYVFANAGTYLVTFVASNNSNLGSAQTVKQLTITVQ